MEEPFRWKQTALEEVEVITHEGEPIFNLPREKLVSLVGSLLRDLKKQQENGNG